MEVWERIYNHRKVPAVFMRAFYQLYQDKCRVYEDEVPRPSGELLKYLRHRSEAY